MTPFLAFEKYRSYYVREHDHKQILGAQMEAHGVDLDWRIRNKCPSVSIDFIYSLRVVCQQNIQNLQLKILHLYSGNYQKIFLVVQFLQNVDFELFFGTGKR